MLGRVDMSVAPSSRKRLAYSVPSSSSLERSKQVRRASQPSAGDFAARDAISARAAATSSSLVLAWPFSPQPPSGASARSTHRLSEIVGAPAATATHWDQLPATATLL